MEPLEVHQPLITQTLQTTQEDMERQRRLQAQNMLGLNDSLNYDDQTYNQQETEYNNFLATLGAENLPGAVPVALPEQPVRKEWFAKKRRKKAYKEYGKKDQLFGTNDVKSLALFDSKEMVKNWSEISHKDVENRKLIDQVSKGDYSNFENLDNVMRNYVASHALRKMLHTYQPDFTDDAEELCDLIRQREGIPGLLNPALRLGLSLAARTEGLTPVQQTFFVHLDEAMTNAVMVETLSKQADPLSVEAMLQRDHADWDNEKIREERDKMIKTNQAQQIQLAKRMLLMQLSDFQVEMQPNRMVRWTNSMAVAISHCSRIVLTLPAVERNAASRNSQAEQDTMWATIYNLQNAEGEYENLAQDNKRTSSTHSVYRRKVSNGPGPSTEKKKWFNLIGQRGMNCAIGGLGNTGVSGKTISNNGSCGHFYSMYKEGSTSRYGVMLMGLESDASGMTNHLGHKHDWHATQDKASALGAQRIDEIGEKYGGRQCNLTGLTAADISAWMIGLETAMKNWQANSNLYELKATMNILCGQKITHPGDIRFLRNRLNIPDTVGGLR